jgi:DNA polymerase V
VFDLVNAALYGLRAIFKTGYLYQKVEVIATGLIPEHEVQLNLFSKWNGPVNDKLSKVMDKINRYYGPGTLRSASEGQVQKWSMRRNFLSPEYTTKWTDIIKVR